MKLWAISDLHVSHQVNLRALQALPPHPDDWLIVAGDVGDSVAQVRQALTLLCERFAKVLWVPGNHELWTLPRDEPESRGQARYEALVAVCRSLGVQTPEDPYLVWPGEGGEHVIALLFLLYDYTFRPPHETKEQAMARAVERGIVCTDELLLDPSPHPSRESWCAARLSYTSRRLEEELGGRPSVLVNHFPLRRDLTRLPAIPEFEIWCGTKATESWHRRYGASVVVTGHLHVRATDVRDQVRFEEVSLGNPRQWTPANGMAHYLRRILPAPVPVIERFGIR